MPIRNTALCTQAWSTQPGRGGEDVSGRCSKLLPNPEFHVTQQDRIPTQYVPGTSETPSAPFTTMFLVTVLVGMLYTATVWIAPM